MVSRIQFREEEMRQGIAELRKGAKIMRGTCEKSKNLAKALDDGGFQGKAGETLSAAFAKTLPASVERLAQKMEERARVMEVELEQLLKAASQLR